MRKRWRRLTVLMATGGMCFGLGCSQDLARTVAFGVRDSLAATFVTLFDLLILSPAVDQVVGGGG